MTIKEFINKAENTFNANGYVSMEIPEELRHCIYDAVDYFKEKDFQKVSVDWDRFYIRSF
jgi:hypothetical protein